MSGNSCDIMMELQGLNCWARAVYERHTAKHPRCWHIMCSCGYIRETFLIASAVDFGRTFLCFHFNLYNSFMIGPSVVLLLTYFHVIPRSEFMQTFVICRHGGQGSQHSGFLVVMTKLSFSNGKGWFWEHLTDSAAERGLLFLDPERSVWKI